MSVEMNKIIYMLEAYSTFYPLIKEFIDNHNDFNCVAEKYNDTILINIDPSDRILHKGKIEIKFASEFIIIEYSYTKDYFKSKKEDSILDIDCYFTSLYTINYIDLINNKDNVIKAFKEILNEAFTAITTK